MPAGSMGPKVNAAMRLSPRRRRECDRPVARTLLAMPMATAGTRNHPGRPGHESAAYELLCE